AITQFAVQADNEVAVATEGSLATSGDTDVGTVVAVVGVQPLVGDSHVDWLEAGEAWPAAHVDGAHGIPGLGLGLLHFAARLQLPVQLALNGATAGLPERLHGPWTTVTSLRVAEADQERTIVYDFLEGLAGGRSTNELTFLEVLVGDVSANLGVHPG